MLRLDSRVELLPRLLELLLRRRRRNGAALADGHLVELVDGDAGLILYFDVDRHARLSGLALSSGGLPIHGVVHDSSFADVGALSVCEGVVLAWS